MSDKKAYCEHCGTKIAKDNPETPVADSKLDEVERAPEEEMDADNLMLLKELSEDNQGIAPLTDEQWKKVVEIVGYKELMDLQENLLGALMSLDEATDQVLLENK